MVHASTMTLVMAEKDQPVFRDFLGLSHGDSEGKQPEYITSEVLRSTRNAAGFESEVNGEAFTPRRRFETSSTPGILSPSFGLANPSSSDPGGVGWQRGKSASLQHHGTKSAFSKPDVDTSKPPRKRDSPSPGGRESLQERLQMSVEAIENSRPQKVARLEHQRSLKKGEYGEAAPSSVDELRLSMQPPRSASNNPPWMQQPTMPDITRSSKRASPRPLHINQGSQIPQQTVQQMGQQMSPQFGLQMPRISHLGACAEREERAVIASRELSQAPLISRPAADEGSRTGLKGSPLAGLINTSTPPAPAGSNGPPPTPRRPKLSAQSGGSDSMIPSPRQGPPQASRQLTIFYGGQAHVFDDVPPEKADAIMALAGSNGRSWSTTYSPRPTASAPNSASEGSLSVLDRERDKTVQSIHSSRGGSVSGGGAGLSLSTEVQTLLRGLAQSGINSARPV